MKIQLNFDLMVEDLKLKDLERLGIQEFSNLQETPKIEWLGSNEHVEIKNSYDFERIKSVEIKYSILANAFIDYLRNLKYTYKEYFNNNYYRIRFPIELFIQDDDFAFENSDNEKEVIVFQLGLSDLCRIVYNYTYDCIVNEIDELKIQFNCKKQNIIDELENMYCFDSNKINMLTKDLENIFTKLNKVESRFDKLKCYHNVDDLID
jgi:hypothetical protein